MGLQEAHDILVRHMLDVGFELCDQYSHEKYQVYKAIEFAVDKLSQEIISYCNLPYA